MLDYYSKRAYLAEHLTGEDLYFALTIFMLIFIFSVMMLIHMLAYRKAHANWIKDNAPTALVEKYKEDAPEVPLVLIYWGFLLCTILLSVLSVNLLSLILGIIGIILFTVMLFLLPFGGELEILLDLTFSIAPILLYAVGILVSLLLLIILLFLG